MTDSTKKSEQEFSSNKPAVSGLNRNQLKYIAAIVMLLDHIGMVFGEFFYSFTGGPVILFILRFLGRLTAPIMCFFLAEGFLHTHSKKSYALRLAIFAIISQVPYALAHKHSLLAVDFNMLFTLLLSFLALCLLEAKVNQVVRYVGVVLLIALSIVCDWAIFAPILVLLIYKFRENTEKLFKSYIIIAVLVVAMSFVFLTQNGYPWYQEIWQLGLLLFIPVRLSYNGEPGSRHPFHKWFFYVFYPMHLMALWGICFFVSG